MQQQKRFKRNHVGKGPIRMGMSFRSGLCSEGRQTSAPTEGARTRLRPCLQSFTGIGAQKTTKKSDAVNHLRDIIVHWFQSRRIIRRKAQYIRGGLIKQLSAREQAQHKPLPKLEDDPFEPKLSKTDQPAMEKVTSTAGAKLFWVSRTTG